MKFAKYLANLGYGSRREVQQLFKQGRVCRHDGTVLVEEDEFTHCDVLVDDQLLDAPPGSVIMLNKPVGYVCSTRDASQLIYELLPHRFRLRSPLMAPVGRLDRDTSGLLLLTDDGQVNHRITSPKAHLPKAYDVELANELQGNERELFASGSMMLESETEPLLPVEFTVTGANRAQLTLREGRYHQVRRMFASVGNHVVALRRVAIGALPLGDLAAGSWRVLGNDDVASIFQR